MISPLSFIRSVMGLPYRIGALGPDAYDCYGFARALLLKGYGVEMPEYDIRTDGVLRLARSQRGRFVRSDIATDGALVVMGGPSRDGHVGVAVALPDAGYVIAHMDEARGAVVEDYHMLGLRGFSRTGFYVTR